jgi:hypothetical protein
MTDLLELTAQLLEPSEREAVLGDLAEAGESGWRGLVNVLGLVIRRQTIPWKSWRPWLAAFGLALPASFLLLGFSLSVSWHYRNFVDMGAGLLLLVSQVFLLAAWSWSSGFVVGSLSRRTLWASIAASCFPCLFCLARFRGSSLPRYCLLLFLVPALCGVYRGLRIARIKLRTAIVVAAITTIAMWSGSVWKLNWFLIWPAWYMVATARKTGSEGV